MMFGLLKSKIAMALAAGLLALSACAAVAAETGDETRAKARYAVIPTAVVYPGDEIDASVLEEVEVTNPNLRSDYVRSIAEIDGLVAVRTLLPGRVIPPNSVRLPFAVKRGKPVRLVFQAGALTITAMGTPLNDGVVGDFIKARNTDTGITVLGTVMEDGSIRVAQK